MGEILTEEDWSYILRDIKDPQCKSDIQKYLQSYEADRVRVLHADERRKLGPFSEDKWDISRPLMARIVEDYAAAINIRERRLELSSARQATKIAKTGIKIAALSMAIALLAAIAAWVAVFK